ncbi:MAG: nucleotidyl transferase AbiEii/AbiGii toxin family protein [Kiritimatiellae bacterium]|nr:nucleotidyl transferase AbiEii/AbiGii toxin family protein [Kiritimatiellia bacterium]
MTKFAGNRFSLRLTCLCLYEVVCCAVCGNRFIFGGYWQHFVFVHTACYTKFCVCAGDVPEPGFSTEQKLLVKPVSRWIRAYSIGDLFAEKVRAALSRAWRTRTKGRDWYDLEWYVRNGFACHLGHLAERCREVAPEIDLSSRAALVAAFRKRIATIDFKSAREDVRPFLKDASCLDIWSQEYFNSLVDMIKVE